MSFYVRQNDNDHTKNFFILDGSVVPANTIYIDEIQNADTDYESENSELSETEASPENASDNGEETSMLSSKYFP